MVTEQIIDKTLDLLHTGENFDDSSIILIDEHPEVIAYLDSESFDILIEEEKDVLWYCLVVLYTAIKDGKDHLQQRDVKEIEAKEEENYEVLGDNNMKYSEMCNLLFEDTKEEDLLAFIEDFLVPDEDEDDITPTGRKVLFITLKTMVDVWSS